MGRRLGARSRLGLVVGLLALMSTAAAAQQSGTVAGIVVTEQGGHPLASVQVGVAGTARRTTTDASGQFRFSGLTGEQVTLEVRRIGYQMLRQTVRVGETNLRFTLSERVVELNAMIVTGTPGATEKRRLGNDVAQISGSDVLEKAPVTNLQSLINGRAPGVHIIPQSGMVGAGSRMTIRGVSSFSLANQPLIYVDGVRVDNAANTGPTVQGFGSRVVSRWNDFNPSDIESIEILKGPAAATLYGTEASSGVIQIITKKGAEGTARWSFTTNQGANWFPDPEGRLWQNYGTVPNATDPAKLDTVTIDIVELENARGTPIFRTGRLQSYDLNVSGGVPMVRYYLGTNLERNEGAERNNQLERFGMRANLNIAPNETFDVQTSVGYVASKTNLSWESGAGGATWSTYFAQPQKLNTPRRGFYSGTPEAYYEGFQTTQEIDRLTGSVQVNHRPLSWLSQRFTLGLDLTNELGEEIAERNDQLAAFFFSELERGYKDVDTRSATYTTIEYSATAEVDVTSSLMSSTSFGAQYFGKYTKLQEAYGESFAAPELRAVAAATQRTGSEDYVENNTIGVFLQEQVGWRNRVFVTAGIRADDNSAFGSEFDLVYYPKASISWIVNEEPFFQLPAIGTLKLRAAYGLSGKQPEAYDALRSWSTVAGEGDVPAVSPFSPGNPRLGPERGEEVELGFDLAALDDRVGLEFTFYNKRTKDAILAIPSPPSGGFYDLRYINAGEIVNRGFETLIRGTPLRTARFDWEMTASLSTNDNEVEDLNGPDFLPVGSLIQHRVGYPIGSWFDKRLVSATYDPATKKAINEMCDDGNGGVVACASAPKVFIGRSTPKYEGAFTSTLTFLDRITLYGLLDFKADYKKLDGNRRVRCNLFAECRENYYPGEFDPVVIAEAQNGTRYTTQLIRDASYAKLRELSVRYEFPVDWAARFGASRASLSLAGRNLATWTKWPGLEPEASFQGGSRGNFGQWEQNVLPQLRQFVTTVSVGF